MKANVRFLSKTGTSEESYPYLESSYQVFFQENAAAMYVASIPQGIIENCNDAFAQLLGFDNFTQVLGRPLAEFFQASSDYEKLAFRLQNENTIHGDLERMRRQDGTLIWVLQDIGVLSADQTEESRILGTAVDITKQKQTEEHFQRHAMYDSLTGLPNRCLFLDRLRLCFDRAQRKSDYQFAVLFLDLDYFKRVNDTYGHRIGDELLVACAKRLHSKIRGADTVARLSGDEFAVLLTEVSDRSETIRVASRIQDAFNHPFQMDDLEIFITVSAGIALSSGHWIAPEQNDGDDPSLAMSSLKKPEDLLWEADEVLYRAKAMGRARYEISNDHFALQLRYCGL